MIARGRQVRCLWVYAPETEPCSTMVGIMWELQRKVRRFHQSGETFWLHNGSVVNRDLVEFHDWRPPVPLPWSSHISSGDFVWISKPSCFISIFPSFLLEYMYMDIYTKPGNALYGSSLPLLSQESVKPMWYSLFFGWCDLGALTFEHIIFFLPQYSRLYIINHAIYVPNKPILLTKSYNWL